MEKFMFLFRGGETHPDNAKSKEEKEYIQLWITWMQDLGQKGILEGGENLLLTGKQVTGKSKVVTDTPFIVNKEMVNGYLIINSKDIDEDTKQRSLLTIFEENGKVEIRPIPIRE